MGISKSYLKELAKNKYKSGGFSTEGYKRNSPDVNNPYNVIPSNRITMKDVDFPIRAISDTGDERIIYPGEEHLFQGNYVTEFPLKNMGNKRFGQKGLKKKKDVIKVDSDEYTSNPIESDYVTFGEKDNPYYSGVTWDPKIKRLVANFEPVDITAKATGWARDVIDYKKKNPIEKFVQSKMQDYIKSQGQWGKNAGLSMENFPNHVMQNYMDEYNRNLNSYAAKRIAKQKGYNLKRRDDWVDKLTPREQEIFSNSKYGSSLQPSVWARTVGGVQELGNTLLPGQPFQFNIPGLSPKEEKEYRESALSGLNVFAPLDLPGTVIANYAKNRGLSTGSNYAELPNPLSGERMGNVSELDATLLSPSTWQGLASLPSLAKSVPSIYKSGKALATGVYNAPVFKVGRDLAAIEKEGKALGLSDFEIARRQMEQVGITSNQRQGYTPLVSELAKKYIKPKGYAGTDGRQEVTKFRETVNNIMRGGYKDVYPEREDAWRLYLGMPQKNNTFSLANTAPINHPAYPSGSLKGMDIYSVNSERALDDIGAFRPEYSEGSTSNSYLDLLDNPISISRDPYIMGGYNRVLTKEGNQYNDIWDLSPYLPFKKLFPKGIADNPRFERLLYKTNPNGSQSVRGFEIPVEKFVGKPFMSHGNLPYASTDYVNDLKNLITRRIEQFEPEINNVFKGRERLAKMRQDLKDLENYPKYKQGGEINFQNQKPKGTYQGGGTMGIPGVNGQVVSSGPGIKDDEGNVKTMSSKQVKQTLKYSRYKPNKI